MEDNSPTWNGLSDTAMMKCKDLFDINMLQADEKLNEGLKRFGSFFTSPLFTENATGRELNAIESENSKNLQSDGFRIYQINKARQNPDHPHSKFFTGDYNREKLSHSFLIIFH